MTLFSFYLYFQVKLQSVEKVLIYDMIFGTNRMIHKRIAE